MVLQGGRVQWGGQPQSSQPRTPQGAGGCRTQTGQAGGTGGWHQRVASAVAPSGGGSAAVVPARLPPPRAAPAEFGVILQRKIMVIFLPPYA